ALFDVASGRRWTYAAMQRDARRWAGRLRAEGVEPGDRVAVLAPNRAETFLLLFACAELGATLFPMNWRLADPELRWQVEHARPRLVLVDPSMSGRLDGLPLDDDPGVDTGDPVPGPGAPLDAPWVLMYTSGSTGRPKGALLTHGQLHWNAVNTQLACDLSPGDSTLTFTPLFHTGGLNCLSTPLFWRGGRVVLAPGFDAAQSLSLIERERVTLLMGVPTIFQMMAEHPAFDGTDLSSVRDALVGGAALPMPLLQRYRERDIPLRQGFGLTEVGPNCFSLPPHMVERKWGSVGMPVAHVAARLARPDGSECEPGEPGELWLSGPAVCGGYLDDDAATQKAMGDGWFRTGDVLERDADGYYYVRGRIKEMYISGGENVYPPEIETVIHGAGCISSCAVVGVPDARWGEVGAAFVAPAPGEPVSTEQIRAHLLAHLARYKVPKYLTILPSLPVTASGKVDKVALREIALRDVASQHSGKG
ncbi:MAG: long-chain fatty acid--CoA ligase, partial [Deltaproteobacteria bacterium]|nr:long-chain fatty acid--CoA ligase [Deltaproteobacteria bacterium]